MKNYKQIKSKKTGPVVTIMGGIHGDEFCGYKAVEYLMQNLQQVQCGTLNLVIANELAIKQSKREVNYNMNRIFRNDLPEDIKNTYEYKRSLEIKAILDTTDILIDLHSSVEGSKPFIICEQNGLELSKCVDVRNILTNIDAFHPGSTDGYMNNNAKIGICIECGYKKDPNSTRFAIESAKALLQKLNIIDTDFSIKEYQQDVYQSDYIYTAKTDDFKLNRSFTDFDFIQAQDIVASDGAEQILFDQNYHILFANPNAKKDQEAFLLVRKIK